MNRHYNSIEDFEHQKTRELMTWYAIQFIGASLLIGIMAFVIVFAAKSAHAAQRQLSEIRTIKKIIAQKYQITDYKAVRAIIGEASGEGYRGMLAVAGAIRNRKTLSGVYGVNAKHIDAQPGWVWELAERAWLESSTHDITNGADHWGSNALDKKWIQKIENSGYKLTLQIKNHSFFKKV